MHLLTFSTGLDYIQKSMKRQESKQEEDVEYDFAKRPRRASAAVEMSGKPASPFPSCVSMKSDASMDWQDKFCQGQTSTREKF
ncbi:hypothetical protein AOLI_G00255820 [Acnodon oligacanthus]